ncbi:hypothetical protein [Peribacillus loiseleuriae]|uniref:hypothetical protein n=1 Tax=Peribacillus loiseleuriae TaxID=1679170 RepID=UPI000AD2107F|nr:hypothetical protein [Peribacillus loiseleuriae]
MRTADGPYTWNAIDDNMTRMTLRNKEIPTGFSKVFAPFMSQMMKRANMKDLKKIKGILDKI